MKRVVEVKKEWIWSKFEGIWSFSEAFSIAVSKHMTGIKIMYSFALNFFAIPIYVFITMISSLEIKGLCCFCAWKVVFLEQLPWAYPCLALACWFWASADYRVWVVEMVYFILNGSHAHCMSHSWLRPDHFKLNLLILSNNHLR
jgi:hypothetical protein